MNFENVQKYQIYWLFWYFQNSLHRIFATLTSKSRFSWFIIHATCCFRCNAIMSFDIESSNDSTSISKYFNKISNNSKSFVAKRTRNVDKRMSVEFEYRSRQKTSQQLNASQKTSINFFKSKRMKLNDNQKSNQLIASQTNHHEIQKMNNSNLNFEYESKTSIVNNATFKSSQKSFRAFSISAKHKKFTSNIHNHFTLITVSIIDVKRLQCNLCTKNYVYDSKKLNQINHMKKEHEIIMSNKSSKKETIYQVKIETTFSRQLELKNKRKNRQLNELLTRSMNKKIIEYLYMRWIIVFNLSFDQTFNDDFRVFLHYINAFVNSMLCRSNNIIKKKIIKLFKKDQKRIEIKLR